MSHTYEFNISMSCGGCSGAVDRALKKLDGEFSNGLTYPAIARACVFPSSSPATCWPFRQTGRGWEGQATGRREMADANRVFTF
jgi:copper chaperone CopZ